MGSIAAMGKAERGNLEAEIASIAMVDAFLDRVNPNHRQDRTKRLLPRNPHVRADMIQ
jgi:hypothetical protein